MEQNIVLGNKRKFVFHFLSSLFFISAISLFEIGGIYSFINDKSKIGAFIQLISIFIIRKSKFPQNPKRSVRFSGKRTKRSVQKRKARNTQKAETKVL